MIHVSDDEFDIIINILKRYAPEGEVWAFGSRQRGSHREHSDLDLALVGRGKLPFTIPGNMKEAFMASLLPFRVDVLDYHAVSPNFQKIIDAEHEVIYKQSKFRLAPIDHIQITVKDMQLAEPFYDKLLPILGYELKDKVSALIEEHDLYVVEYLHPDMDFGICSPRTPFKDDPVHRRKPGSLHHLAFRARSRAEVDRLYAEIQAIGAAIVHAPRIFPGHGPNYYALFFKDPDGIKYEIVCTRAE